MALHVDEKRNKKKIQTKGGNNELCQVDNISKWQEKNTRKIRKTKEKERTTLASGLGVVKIKKKI